MSTPRRGPQLNQDGRTNMAKKQDDAAEKPADAAPAPAADAAAEKPAEKKPREKKPKAPPAEKPAAEGAAPGQAPAAAPVIHMPASTAPVKATEEVKKKKEQPGK